MRWACVCLVGCGRVAFDPVATSYRDVVLADGPVVYWRMGIASGTTVPDETGGGNDLMLHGTVTLGATGAIAGDPDPAIAFDGATGYGVAADAAPMQFLGTQAFTVECWQARAQPPDTNYEFLVNLTSGDGPQRTGWVLYLAPPGNPDGPFLDIERDTPMSDYIAAPLPAIGTYVHTAAVFDGANGALYLDGGLVQTLPFSGSLSARSDGLFVGKDHDLTYWFPGSLDEIAIYDHALTPAQIAHHNAVGRGE